MNYLFYIAEMRSFFMKFMQFIRDCLIKGACNFKRNLKYTIMDIKSIGSATSTPVYWHTFYNQRYATYSKLDIASLRRLLAIKSSDVNVNLSYAVASVMLLGLIGLFKDEIIYFINVINGTFTIPAEQIYMYSFIAESLIMIDLVLPLICWIVTTIFSISLRKSIMFYSLMFTMAIFLGVHHIIANTIWVPTIIVVLAICNLVGFIVLVLDYVKQRLLIECEVIRTVIDES